MISFYRNLALGLIPYGLIGLAQAGGYQMQQRSVSGLGRGLSGESAIADDASVLASNPAGLLWLKPGWHFSKGISYVRVNGGVDGNFNGNPTRGSAGVNSPVPSSYLGWNSGRNLAMGLAIHSPFAQHTDYESDFNGLSLADETKFKAIAIRPSVAWKFNDKFAIGGSVDFLLADGEISSSAPRGGGSLLHLKGDDTAFGFSLGAMWQATDKTRFGMQFSSKKRLNLSGDALSDLVVAFNSESSMELELPETVELSVFHELNDKWAIHGDVLWTNWSRFQTLAPKLANGAMVPEERQNWDDTFRLSVGATYRYNEKWKFRGGIAWDQTPVPTSTRALRNPGSDTLWLSVGATYQMNDKHSLDIGLAYIMGEKVDISQTSRAGMFAGQAQSNLTVLGLQLNKRF